MHTRNIDELVTFGKIEGITGPMGCGKTNQLIEKVRKLRMFAKDKGFFVVVVKPKIDTRLFSAEVSDDKDKWKLIESRDKIIIDGVYPVDSSDELYTLLDNAKKTAKQLYESPFVAMAISEIQLFQDSGILDFMRSLDDKTYLIWEGLNFCFRGPEEYFLFGDYQATMKDVINLTGRSNIKFRSAVCEIKDCTIPADYTQRLDVRGNPDHWSSPVVIIGDEQYQARCESHLKVPGKREASILEAIIIKAGDYGIQQSELFRKGGEVYIPEWETQKILDAFHREKQISMDEGQVIRYTGRANLNFFSR